jgi:hypothetical protein
MPPQPKASWSKTSNGAPIGIWRHARSASTLAARTRTSCASTSSHAATMATSAVAQLASPTDESADAASAPMSPSSSATLSITAASARIPSGSTPTTSPTGSLLSSLGPPTWKTSKYRMCWERVQEKWLAAGNEFPGASR